MPPDLDIDFTLNGVRQRARVDAGTSLLALLRDVVGLTGTKYGCGEGECGACTVSVDGRAVCACIAFAADADGRSIVTVEGLGADPRGAALREAFVEQGAVQCGFCTPGMMVQATQLLARCPRPDAAAAKSAIEGNLCRCTGYQKIVEAIVAAGEKLAARKEAVR
ncbi:MAG: (2Fe-2S)-binding protein [Rubrivivax sp.]|nr:(2Fe-2S)-binding protein [Rubrivivax sp.]